MVGCATSSPRTVNQENRIKLMLAVAKEELNKELAEKQDAEQKS